MRRSAFIGDFSALERQQRILDEDALADETVAREPVSAGKIPCYEQGILKKEAEREWISSPGLP